MATRKPEEKYSFVQHRLQHNDSPRWEIQGISNPTGPNYYTINKANIIKIYNESDHGREQPELDRMGEINEAFHERDFERMRQLIEDTRENLLKHPRFSQGDVGKCLQGL